MAIMSFRCEGSVIFGEKKLYTERLEDLEIDYDRTPAEQARHKTVSQAQFVP